MVYKIKGLGIRDQSVGTVTKPFLYGITSGKFNHKSIVLHCKINEQYYEYSIKRVNSSTCDLKCNQAKCLARGKFELRGEFIKATGKNKYNKTVYNINRSELALRNPAVWTALKKDSPIHTCTPSTFLKAAARDIREMHTDKTLVTGKSHLNSVIDQTELGKLGSDFVGSFINSSHEKMSARCKLAYKRSHTIGEVPESCQHISLSNKQD